MSEKHKKRKEKRRKENIKAKLLRKRLLMRQERKLENELFKLKRELEPKQIPIRKDKNDN